MVLTKCPLAASNEGAKNTREGSKCAKKLKERQGLGSFHSNGAKSCR